MSERLSSNLQIVTSQYSHEQITYRTGNLVRLNFSDSRDGARAHMFVLEVVLNEPTNPTAVQNLVSEYKQDGSLC
jgi:hypothetical protein